MDEEQKKVWDRLKNGIPEKRNIDIRDAYIAISRSLGKTALSFQALGRAMKSSEEIVWERLKKTRSENLVSPGVYVKEDDATSYIPTDADTGKSIVFLQPAKRRT